MPKLIITYSDGIKEEKDLGALPLVAVGRGSENNVVLTSPRVSRNHFLLEKSGDTYRLVNRSETQGTFLNGSRVESSEIRSGDIISAGDVRIEFSETPAARPPSRPSDLLMNPFRNAPSAVSQTDPSKSVMIAADSEQDGPDVLASADPADSTLMRLMLDRDTRKNVNDELYRRFALIQDIVQEMVTELRLSHLLGYILERIFEIMHADNGAILLLDTDKVTLVPKAVRERNGSKGSKQLRISRTLIRKVCQERLGYLCADALSDEALRSQQSIVSFGIRSAMCVPLLYRDELLGVIHIDSESTQNSFTRDDLQLLTLMANQAAVCVRNAWLHDRIIQAETQRTNLGRYFSPQVVDKICTNEINLELGGKNVEVSLLYSDIRGFTSLSERVSAQDLVAFLNAYFTEMADIVFLYNGTCDKFIGDAILAVFGSPIPDPEHAINAAKCALSMMERLQQLDFGIGPIRIGIGIHCGPVIHGNIGSEKVMQYTVIGDHVNTTSRLSDVAAPNQIVMSAAMRDQLGSRGVSKPLGLISLKGKSAPLETFELLQCE